MRKIAYKRITMIYGLIILMLACIPREDPPERGAYLEQIHTLPAQLSENSGMTESNGLIWIINDSGNEPSLYGYNNSTNQVDRKIVVKGLGNTDWEDITQNDEYIFIGDFGNNAGSRTDLKIILIRKTDMVSEDETDTVAPAGVIDFRFEDQTDFTYSPEKTSYDCEAFIATSEKILLFTKDWLGHKTKVYELPVTPGNYVAARMDEWSVNGLITAAAWSADKQQLYLLGYTDYNITIPYPFLWIYEDFDPEIVTFSSSRRIDLNNLGAQTEGLMISTDGTLLVSAESTQYGGPTIYSLKGLD